MDTKDLSILEFPRIRAILAGYCSFPMSREAAEALTPSRNLAEVQARLTESAEARQLLAEEPSISASGMEDSRECARAAALGRVLDPQALCVVRRTVEILRLLRNRVVQHAAHLPVLAKISGGIGVFNHLEKAINGAISPDGEILSEASPALASIRHRERRARADLVDKLQSFIASDTARRYIQEPIVTEREGRYVIAVKAEHRGEVQGIVHDVSNTGATLFLEPWQTLELGNAVKELQIEEAREIERILREISTAIGQSSDDIATSLQQAAELDLALAKARFAARYQAVEAAVYQPSGAEAAVIHLEGARHPLLGAGAVPLDLELGRDFNVLIITGPNTGGKTVALKTIGLMCVMTQAGLPIPAAPGSRLPILDGIFADIGDEQSILETLSTFGWHMSNISRILKAAIGHNLVLLDELGASTDPQEGSALARAILLQLLANHQLGVVTTHYTELKVFAHVTRGLQNASFDFDPVSFQPTFHLTLGTPGGSNAIVTAAHFGLPDEVVRQAREFLSAGARQLEELLASLQTEKQRLEDLNKDIGREKETFARQNETLTAELVKMRQEKQRLIQAARDSIIEEVAELQKELKQAAAAIKKEKTEAALAGAHAASQRVRERLKSGALAEKVETAPVEDETIHIGDSILIKDVGVTATVTAINDRTGQIEAAAGSLRFRLGRDSMVKATAAAISRHSAGTRVTAPSVRAAAELDLRGRRAEEVEPLLDTYLNDAALSNRSSVRVIHGFGTGVVRDIVREQAAHHPLVRSFHSAPQNEGGDGATIVVLR